MHWSASGTRASDEFLISLAPAADVSPLKNTAYTELPTHDPISDVTKKDLAWHHKCWDIAIYWQYPTTNCGLVEASLMPQLVA